MWAGAFEQGKTYPCADPKSVYLVYVAETSDGAEHRSDKVWLSQP